MKATKSVLIQKKKVLEDPTYIAIKKGLDDIKAGRIFLWRDRVPK